MVPWTTSPQHSPQHPNGAVIQHPDTIRILVPVSQDTSLKLRLTSGTVQVRDTVYVKDTNSRLDAWATFAVTAALVGVTIYTAKKAHDLQQRSTQLQKDFNDMQAKHERERREIEERHATEHRLAVDAKVSGVAYAVFRQLMAVVNEIPDEVSLLVQTLGEQRKTPGYIPGTESSGLTVDQEESVVAWSAATSGGVAIDRLEARFTELIAAAPDATEPIAASIRRSFVLFYEGAHLLQNAAGFYHEHGFFDGDAVVDGYRNFEKCMHAVAAAISPELIMAGKKL